MKYYISKIHFISNPNKFKFKYAPGNIRVAAVLAALVHIGLPGLAFGSKWAASYLGQIHSDEGQAEVRRQPDRARGSVSHGVRRRDSEVSTHQAQCGHQGHENREARAKPSCGSSKPKAKNLTRAVDKSAS